MYSFGFDPDALSVPQEQNHFEATNAASNCREGFRYTHTQPADCVVRAGDNGLGFGTRQSVSVRFENTGWL